MADHLVLSLPQARRLAIRSQHLAGPEPVKGIDAIEDRAAVSWTSTGWTNGRNVERMLDILWKQGVVTVAGRDGLRRLWGLADFPAAEDLPQAEVAPRVDRRRGVLVVEGMFAEPEFAGAAVPPDGSVAEAIESLASFAGAASVSYSGPVAFGVS